MSNLSEAISIINQAEAKRCGKTMGASRLGLQAAMGARDAAVSAVEQAKARRDDLNKVPLDSLPDSDDEIGAHLTKLKIADIHVLKAEKVQGDAQAVALAAQHAFDVEAHALQDQHQAGVVARSKFEAEFKQRLETLSAEAATLLGEALDLEAWAKAIKAGGDRPLPKASETFGARMELVDAKGRSLFKFEPNAPLAGAA